MRIIHRGFTLVEVMIALTLSLLLVAGLTRIFLANKQTFDVATASARTQENGRMALSVLSRAIRNADYWGCQGSKEVLQGSFTSLLNDSSGSEFGLLLRGLDGENGTGPDESDQLILGGLASGSGVNVTQQPSPTAANLKVQDASGFAENDIVVVTNCHRGHLFQVTNVNSNNGVLVHNTGNVSAGPGNATKTITPSYNDDPRGAMVYLPDQKIFYLRDNTRTGRRELVLDGVLLDPVALLEGVRDFQFELGRDANGDGRVDVWSPPGDPDHADQAVAIRMSLLVRSGIQGLTDGDQSYCYPGWLDCLADPSLETTSGENDTFLYRVYTATTALRNRI